MRTDGDKHRRSIRLPGYDYAQAGAYFITIVTQGRACLFGQVVNGATMRLDPPGEMVARWWLELARKYPHAVPDACAVMPNHLHGILILHPCLVGADLRVCPVPGEGAHTPGEGAHTGAPLRKGVPRDVAPLSRMVQWFKTMTTNAYIQGIKGTGWPPFCGRLWQRNYYEHVVHNAEELHCVRQYIVGNPARWAQDPENPMVVGAGLKPAPTNDIDHLLGGVRP